MNNEAVWWNRPHTFLNRKNIDILLKWNQRQFLKINAAWYDSTKVIDIVKYSKEKESAMQWQ